MIRHPFLLACEALCALAISLVAHLTPVRQPPQLGFAVSALGELQLEDGSWAGVDLLRNPDAPVDRFQLSVRPTAPSQLAIDVIGDDGAQRLFPAPGQSGLLRPGAIYALPGPHGFYELAGRAHLRVSLRRLDSSSAPLAVAQPLPDSRLVPFRLSDGAPFSSSERAFVAPAGGRLDLAVRGHQGEVAPTPATSE